MLIHLIITLWLPSIAMWTTGREHIGAVGCSWVKEKKNESKGITVGKEEYRTKNRKHRGFWDLFGFVPMSSTCHVFHTDAKYSILLSLSKRVKASTKDSMVINGENWEGIVENSTLNFIYTPIVAVKAPVELGLVVHVCNFSVWEAEAGSRATVFYSVTVFRLECKKKLW